MKRKFIILAFLLSVLYTYALPSLIPMPHRVEVLRGQFVFEKNTVINYSNASLYVEAKLLKELLHTAMGIDFQYNIPKSKSMIMLKMASEKDSIGNDGYLLKVQTGKIEITASHSAGFFYAFQTLMQLLPAEIYGTQKVKTNAWKIDGVFIQDQPLFSWRGSMLDVSRQFYDIKYLKMYINWLAAHKLNVFQLHLTDDEGWRIEIKSFPKLTEIGAWRGPNEALPPAHGSGDNRYGGFYTQDELKDLVQYAAKRNIQILPEIDVPGHGKSVAVAYPEMLCTGNDSTESVQGVKRNVWCAAREYNFDMLDKIIGEVAMIFPMEYIHIGGDEVNHKAWDNCPLCKDLMIKNGYSISSQLQSYFISRMEKILEKHGKKMMGWNEILKDAALGKNTAVMAWTSVAAGVEAVKKQHDVVLTPASFFYIDMAQGNNERGHRWASLLPTERLYSYQIPTDSLSRKYVKGIQANLWAEYLDQPAYQTDYQSYPRLCALAELAWSGNRMTFENFENRLNAAHYDRLFYLGIHFRVPPPVIQLQKGKLQNKTGLKNTTVYYSTDGSIPTTKSMKLNNQTDYKDLDMSALRFVDCYRDSLLSAVVPITYDTFCVWNGAEAAARKLEVLKYRLSNLKPAKSLLFRYLYGSDKLAISKIIINKNGTLIFEKRYEKPIILFARMTEWEVLLPDDIWSKKGDYSIEIHTLGTKPLDNKGVILLK